MILYHGTSEENKLKIIKEGFKTGYGEFGTGVYFATTKDIAYDYGIGMEVCVYNTDIIEII